MRKLTAFIAASVVAAAMAGAGAASANDGLVLHLTSTTPGASYDGAALVCPPVMITASQGADTAACEITITSTGSVTPDSVRVDMTVSGATAGEISSRKFAVVPQAGASPAYFGTSPQEVYAFAGSQLPVTVDPGVEWGMTGALDNGDLGATMTVTYTVVATSGAAPSPSSSLPPTTTSRGALPGGGDPASLYAASVCLAIGLLAMAALLVRRRRAA